MFGCSNGRVGSGRDRSQSWGIMSESLPLANVRLLIAAKRAEGVEPIIVSFSYWKVNPPDHGERRWIVLQDDTYARWMAQYDDV